MSVKVFKFGGSLLNNIEGFKQIKKIVELYLETITAEPNNLIIVVSAFGKTTSKLLKAAITAEIKGEISAMPIVNDIVGYHINIVDTLIKDKKKNTECKTYIQEQHTKLVNYIKGISLTRELSLRTKDLVLSIGEMLATNVVNKYLSEYFSKVITFDIVSALKTNDNYGSAIPNIELTKKHIDVQLLPLFKYCNIIITQGFIGSTTNDEITTMGYESSNLTATILAGLTDADEFIIWTDVEGIRQYDPKLTTDKYPDLINKISYDFAEYLGYSGLKLIYPRMIGLLRQFNLEVIYKSGLKPSGEYTIIGQEGDITESKIIIYSDNLVAYSESNIVDKFNESCFLPIAHLLEHQSSIIFISHDEYLFVANENVPLHTEKDLLLDIQLHKIERICSLSLINFDFTYYIKVMNNLEKDKDIRDEIINIFVNYQRKTTTILYKENGNKHRLAKHFIDNY
jgi:aspartate kinase